VGNEWYKIVKYRPEFKSRLLDLQAHLWGQDPATRAAYLEWKYDRNPYTDDTNIYLALYNEQLVGMVGAYGAKWEFGDLVQTFPGLCFADLVILPRHRNRDLFPKLMTFALDDLSETGCAYAFDLSAAPHVALGLLMQGWRSIFIQTASRTIDPATQSGNLMENEQKLSRFTAVYRQIYGHLDKLPLLVSIYRRLRRYMYDPISRRVTGTRRAFVDLDGNAGRHKINSRVTLSKTARPRAMAELAERIGTDGRIRHVRDEQYLSWRFQNPLSEYRFLFWEKKRLDGYFVLHTKLDQHSNDASTYIVDWEATNVQVWIDLLQATIHWGNFKDIVIWSATLSGEVKKLLAETGFTFLDKSGSVRNDIHGGKILVQSLCRKTQQSDWILADRDLLDPANWNLRMIYSDAY